MFKIDYEDKKMDKFAFEIPTKIFFGKGSLQDGLIECKNLFEGTAMIITGINSMKRLGFIEMLELAIKENINLDGVIVFSGISPNPRATEVNEAITMGIKNNVTFVVGFGGGSVIDAAKAVAVGIGANEMIDEYVLNGKPIIKKTLPILAIPTTAGSGSELSKGAIISFPDKKIKAAIRGKKLYPTIAIIDPIYTYQLSKKITCETGFDVFTHATETFISRNSNPYTEMLSLEALKIISKYLLILAENQDDKEAREKMSYASMLMGINLGNSSTCLPHRLQYPIGAKTDTSHSSGLASIYKSWVYHSYEYSEIKFNQIGTILSGVECVDRRSVINSISIFMELIGVNIQLKELGIELNHLNELADNVNGNINSDPASIDKLIVRKIYFSAYNNSFE